MKKRVSYQKANEVLIISNRHCSQRLEQGDAKAVEKQALLPVAGTWDNRNSHYGTDCPAQTAHFPNREINQVVGNCLLFQPKISWSYVQRSV